MVEQTDERMAVSVPLNAAARRLLDTIKADSGVAKVEAISRMLEAVASLDAPLVAAVLHRKIESKRELTAALLKDLAAEQAATAEFGPLHMLDIDQLSALLTQVNHHLTERAKGYRDAARSKGKKS